MQAYFFFAGLRGQASAYPDRRDLNWRGETDGFMSHARSPSSGLDPYGTCWGVPGVDVNVLSVSESVESNMCKTVMYDYDFLIMMPSAAGEREKPFKKIHTVF